MMYMTCVVSAPLMKIQKIQRIQKISLNSEAEYCPGRLRI